MNKPRDMAGASRPPDKKPGGGAAAPASTEDSGALAPTGPTLAGLRCAAAFEALGEPTRLRIMRLLPREPRCDAMYNVVELADELGLTQPTVSHHLKILSETGLVLCRRQCNSLYFYVNQPVVEEFLAGARHWLLADAARDL